MIYAATILVLFRDREITTEILSQYPPLCQQKQNVDDQSKCQKSLSDILSTGVARDQLNALIDDACSWAVEYAPGDCVPNQDFDDRLTLEPLGTDFIFTCPMRYWLQNHGQGQGSPHSPSQKITSSLVRRSLIPIKTILHINSELQCQSMLARLMVICGQVMKDAKIFLVMLLN